MEHLGTFCDLLSAYDHRLYWEDFDCCLKNRQKYVVISFHYNANHKREINQEVMLGKLVWGERTEQNRQFSSARQTHEP